MKQLVKVYIESSNGDDRLGIDTATGNMMTDIQAEQQGVNTFVEGIPQSRVAEVVKEQLKDGKWVTTQKKDGTTEILTKDDLPDIELDTDVEHYATALKDNAEVGVEDDTEDTEGNPEKVFFENATKKVEDKPFPFSIDMGKPKPTVKTTTVKDTKPKFESRFEDVESATATTQSKGG